MGRAPCCDKNGLKKGPWTPEEDQKLIDYINKHGSGNWRSLPKNAGLQRCGKSCRLRWTNYLRPDIKRGRFSFEEEETIIQLHSILGNKWSAIAARLPGRTDNEIKNYWNTHIRKRLLKMGIDPVTHNPRLDLSSFLNTSLYNNLSQVNISRLLGMQGLVNPEVLRFATSLLSSQNQDSNQFVQENLICNSQVQNQMPQLVQASQVQTSFQDGTTCTALSTTPSVTFTSDHEANLEHLSSNVPNYSSQNCQLNHEISQDYFALQDNYGYYHEPLDQSIVNPTPSSDDASTFQSVLSTFSTRSSSPTPLNSNSTYINSSSTTTEDERDSYCSNMLYFDHIQNILDVNSFM